MLLVSTRVHVVIPVVIEMCRLRWSGMVRWRQTHMPCFMAVWECHLADCVQPLFLGVFGSGTACESGLFHVGHALSMEDMGLSGCTLTNGMVWYGVVCFGATHQTWPIVGAHNQVNKLCNM